MNVRRADGRTDGSSLAHDAPASAAELPVMHHRSSDNTVLSSYSAIRKATKQKIFCLVGIFKELLVCHGGPY